MREPVVLLCGLMQTAQIFAADGAWSFSAAQHAALERGEILVEAILASAELRGLVRAAVRIAQPAGAIYAVMTDCTAALRYVPRLETCRVLETSVDGRAQVIEHVADLGRYLPATRYVFRADYVPERRIAFRLVRGDLRELEGEWRLLTTAAGAATIVTYQVRLAPKLRVPRWAVRRSLKHELPALLTALRAYTQASAARQERPSP